MSYVYIRNKSDLPWTVGFYDPSGAWHAESYHGNSESAARRVAYLNGALRDPKKNGRALGEAGMHAVRANNEEWCRKVRVYLDVFLVNRNGETFLAEDFRRWAISQGLEPPTSPNAWGAIWNSFKTAKLVQVAGMAPSIDPRSHGRMQPRWEAAGNFSRTDFEARR